MLTWQRPYETRLLHTRPMWNPGVACGRRFFNAALMQHCRGVAVCRSPCRGSGQGKIPPLSRGRPGSPHEAQGSACTLTRVPVTLVEGRRPQTRAGFSLAAGPIPPCLSGVGSSLPLSLLHPPLSRNRTNRLDCDRRAERAKETIAAWCDTFEKVLLKVVVF